MARRFTLDHPAIAKFVALLQEPQSPDEWKQHMAVLVVFLVMEAERWPKPMNTEHADRLLALMKTVEAGPVKHRAHRPRADRQAVIDAELFNDRKPATPADGAHLLLEQDAFYRQILETIGNRREWKQLRSYDAALKRAQRAGSRGGYIFPQKGARFRSADKT